MKIPPGIMIPGGIFSIKEVADRTIKIFANWQLPKMQYLYLRLGVYSTLTAIFLNGVVNESQSLFSVVTFFVYSFYLIFDTLMIYLKYKGSGLDHNQSFLNALSHNGIDVSLFAIAMALSVLIGQ